MRAGHIGQEKLLNGTKWSSVCTGTTGGPVSTWVSPQVGETKAGDRCVDLEVLHMALVETL